MNVREAAQILGGDLVGQRSINAPGPGHSTRDRSLSVKFDIGDGQNEGFVVFSHAGDDFLQCRDYVRERLGLGQWKSENTASLFDKAHPKLDQFDRIRNALRIWDEAADPQHTIVEAYLASRYLSLDADVAKNALRFHPSLVFDGGRTPGMVALFRDIETDDPCGIHRTFLSSEGRKLDRRMLGRAKGAAIKLDANENVTLGLTIGEGIETCLSGRVTAFTPAWALGSANAIAGFPALAGIQCLTILGETDATGANDRATKTCARRWLETGAEVILAKPKALGDFNDVLRRVQT